MAEKVAVYSSTAGVSLINTDMRFRRTWAKKGAKHEIDKEILEDLLSSDPGTENLFKMGYLYIKDSVAASDMGADPSGEIYNDERLKLLLTSKTPDELKEAIRKMAPASREALIEMAKSIEVDADHIIAIREVTGVSLKSAQDILRNEKVNPTKEDTAE